MAKIGIFDSGCGGLSVLKEVLKLLPEEEYVYYADNAYCPYGEKSPEFIIERSRKITDMLLARGCDVIIVACNTATAAAIAWLREHYNIKFIGMEPAVKQAALSTQSGVIGVLATASTLKAGKYLHTKSTFQEKVRVIEHIGEGFVEMVESGNIHSPQAIETVRKSVEPLLEAGADRIVLGCTHYPFLTDAIRKVIDESHPTEDIQIIDPAPAVARQLIKVMDEEGIRHTEGTFSIELLASGSDKELKIIYANII